MALITLALVPASALAACGGATGSSTASSSASSTTAAITQPHSTTPNGNPPAGMGTVVTGTAATKASKAATAKYAGTVERVMQLADGSYVVHVTTSSGEQHVKESAAFKVTGLETRPQGGPPNGGAGGMPQGSGATADEPAPTTPPSGPRRQASAQSGATT